MTLLAKAHMYNQEFEYAENILEKLLTEEISIFGDEHIKVLTYYNYCLFF